MKALALRGNSYISKTLSKQTTEVQKNLLFRWQFRRCCVGHTGTNSIRGVVSQYSNAAFLAKNGTLFGPGAAPRECTDVCGCLKSLETETEWRIRSFFCV